MTLTTPYDYTTWQTVYTEGKQIYSRSGDAEGGFYTRTNELEVDGEWFAANCYSSEARTIRALDVFDPDGNNDDEGAWKTVWSEETQ